MVFGADRLLRGAVRQRWSPRRDKLLAAVCVGIGALPRRNGGDVANEVKVAPVGCASASPDQPDDEGSDCKQGQAEQQNAAGEPGAMNAMKRKRVARVGGERGTTFKRLPGVGEDAGIGGGGDGQVGFGGGEEIAGELRSAGLQRAFRAVVRLKIMAGHRVVAQRAQGAGQPQAGRAQIEVQRDGDIFDGQFIGEAEDERLTLAGLEVINGGDEVVDAVLVIDVERIARAGERSGIGVREEFAQGKGAARV